MKRQMIYALAIVGLTSFAANVRATFIGNDLVQRDNDTDTSDYTLNVFKSAPMPTDGYIDGLAIWQQVSGETFTFRLLHYTGVGEIYNQYYVSPAFGTYGDASQLDQVRFYWDWTNAPQIQVQQGDLFAIYGKGVPFSSETSADQVYYNGTDFLGSSGTIDLSTAPAFSDQRVYSAAVTFTSTAAPGPAPEPATLFLLGAPLAFLMQRRNRASK